jgi:hypothetical protein
MGCQHLTKLEQGIDFDTIIHIIIITITISIKDRIVVRYINEFGEEEAGIDVGGLFKDFLTDLTGRVFNPGKGYINTNHQC